jgi:hypothetical protein
MARVPKSSLTLLGRSSVRTRWLVPALLALLLVAALAAAAFVGARLLLNDIAPYQMVIAEAPDMNRSLAHAIVSPLSDTEVLISGEARSYRYDLTTGAQILVGGDAPDGEMSEQVVVPDGGLFVTTFQGNNADQYAYVFDPATNAFHRLSFGPNGATANDPIYGVTPSIALLQDGTVLIAGGHYQAETSRPQIRPDAVIFEPSDESFLPITPMSTPRERQSMTALNDGRVLLAGGYSARAGGHLGTPAVVTNLNTAEIYNPQSQQFEGPITMPDMWGENLAVRLTDGRVALFRVEEAMFGNPDPAGPFAVVVFNPADDTFTTVGSVPGVPQTATALRDGRVLLTGTSFRMPDYQPGTNYDRYVPWAAVFDPRSGISTPVDGINAEQVGVAALPDGDVVIAGGLAYPPPDQNGQGTGESFTVPWVQIFK